MNLETFTASVRLRQAIERRERDLRDLDQRVGSVPMELPEAMHTVIRGMVREFVAKDIERLKAEFDAL